MKSRGITKPATVIAALAASLALAAPALAAPAVDGEFAVSSIGTNNQLTTGPDGNIWVALDAGNDVAQITPAGVVTEFSGPDLAFPTGIAAGPDGKLWVTQPTAVVSFDPTDPVNTDSLTAVPAIVDARGIVSGPGGNLWTASGSDLIRIPPAAPATFQVIPVAGLQGARSITVGGDGNLWIGDSNSTGGDIFSVSPDGATITPYTVDPGAGGSVNVQGIAAGAGTQIGFTNPQGNPQVIGRLEPGGTPQLTPAPGTDAFGLTFGSDQAYWAAQFTTDNVGRVAADGTYTTVGNFTSGSGPRQIAAGPNNTLWVTLDLGAWVANAT